MAELAERELAECSPDFVKAMCNSLQNVSENKALVDLEESKFSVKSSKQGTIIPKNVLRLCHDLFWSSHML